MLIVGSQIHDLQQLQDGVLIRRIIDTYLRPIRESSIFYFESEFHSIGVDSRSINAQRNMYYFIGLVRELEGDPVIWLQCPLAKRSMLKFGVDALMRNKRNDSFRRRLEVT